MSNFDKNHFDQLKKEKKYQELFSYCYSFFNSNDPKALKALSDCYYYELGTEKDYTKCFELDCRAAKTNDPDSIATLGIDYKLGIGVVANIEKAIELFMQAEKKGSAKAMTNLGYCYENGDGIEKDLVKAVEYYQKAADQGYAQAQCDLGSCYENGVGVEKDLSKAVEYYQKAADQGYAQAQCDLARCFEYEIGLKKDLSKAVEYYQKAADQDYAPAQRRLGRLYECGIGVKKNFSKALEYYRKAAEQKDAHAQCALGCCYEYGIGVIKNLSKAVEYYQKAADQSESLAQFHLGCFYEEGIVVEKNINKAFELYKSSAEQFLKSGLHGLESAMISLSRCYKYGLGTPQNKDKADIWMKNAELLMERKIAFSSNPYSKGIFHLDLGDYYCNSSYDDRYEKGNQEYLKAFNCFSTIANGEKSMAQLEIGKLYFYGKGVGQDLKEAFAIFERLSMCDNRGIRAISKYFLAKCYFFGYGIDSNFKKGFNNLKSSYDDGHYYSLIHLIYCYMIGIGVKKDYKKAALLMHKLDIVNSENNNIYLKEANLLKGIDLFYGIGIEKNIEKAKEYFKESFSIGVDLFLPVCSGDYTFADDLGLLYSDMELAFDYFLFCDYNISEYFYKIAFNNGTISAGGTLSYFNILMDNSFISSQNRKQAFKVIMNDKIDAEKNVDILRKRGQCFFYGNGTKKNYLKAVTYFEKAVDLADDISRVYLSLCYANGYGVEKNTNHAKKVLSDGAELNCQYCGILLGLLTYSGKYGFEKDKEKSRRLLNQFENGLFLFSNFLFSSHGDSYISFFLKSYFLFLHFNFDKSCIKSILSPLYIVHTLWLKIFKDPKSINMSTRKMIKKLINEQDNTNNKLDSLQTEISFIKKTGENISDTIEILPKIYEKQNETLDFLESIKDFVLEQKEAVPNEKSLKYLSEDQIEQILSHLIEETTTGIIDKIYKNTSSVKKEEAQLQGLFGQYWMMLDEYTRKSMLSARVLLNNCSNPEFADLDHSGVVISASSALENEIKKRLFIGYKKFLHKKFGPSSSGKWPEITVFHNNKGETVENTNFTLGSLPYLFDGNERDKELLSEYLEKILTKKYKNNGIKNFTEGTDNSESFINKSENVRIHYRNDAAHTKYVARSKANKCCFEIIGQVEASEKIGRVQGLLYDLVQLTEDFKPI